MTAIKDQLIVVLLGLLAIILFLFILQRIMWLFRWGRYRAEQKKLDEREADRLSFIVVDFVVKIVNDFRHLPALIVFAIFGGCWCMPYLLRPRMHSFSITCSP